MFLLFITRRVSPFCCRHLLWLANKFFLYGSLCHQFQTQRQSQPKHHRRLPMHCPATLRYKCAIQIKILWKTHPLLTLISNFFFLLRNTKHYCHLLKKILSNKVTYLASQSLGCVVMQVKHHLNISSGSNLIFILEFVQLISSFVLYIQT